MLEVTEPRPLGKLLMSLPESRLVNDASHGCEHAAAGLVDTTSATDIVSVVRPRLGAMMPDAREDRKEQLSQASIQNARI